MSGFDNTFHRFHQTFFKDNSMKCLILNENVVCFIPLKFEHSSWSVRIRNQSDTFQNSFPKLNSYLKLAAQALKR